ncbi:High osmolarity signaling protein SHO1 [Mycena sanguinolenta]|uniref:High osmolarity signaling protein SHO1 n=1 Tax=Mycena sanguinolenta TaxID=230812 RepID=A0A8H6XJM0_9AGAR|nr:High osmolarity signaling protein SHO1 [Mycena sanguinolenta]
MAASDALIRWNLNVYKPIAKNDENSRRDSSRWAVIALFSPAPGRTLGRVYTSLGAVLEKQANRAAHSLGLGPQNVAKKIKCHFGNGEERVRQLELLRTSVPSKLEKRCVKLMKYALPTESADTQRQAFKEILDLATLFPGLRSQFLRSEYLNGATSIDTVFAALDRDNGSPDEEWDFWKRLAATCLTETTISAVIEGTSISDLSNCQQTGLSAVEQLLIEHDCPDLKSLRVRYLGGILDMPGFWRDMGKIQSYVADKLCCELARILKDVGVDLLILGPPDESEPPFDYEGVDFLASIVLNGFSSLFSKLHKHDWAIQPWYDSFCEVVKLLRGPRAAEFLSHSFACATNAFNDIIPICYKDGELGVIVDDPDQITAAPDRICDDHLADLNCDNNSIRSVHSKAGDQHSRRGPDSLKEDGSDGDQASDAGSMEASQEILSTTDDESVLSDLKLDDCPCQVPQPQCDTRNVESDIGQRPNSHGDPALGPSGTHRVAGGFEEDLASSTQRLSLTARWKEAEDRRIILLQKQRDCGKDDPETLHAMFDLAWTLYELGDYGSARDFQLVILEMRGIVLGEDHPETLRTMGALGKTWIELGRWKKAEGLYTTLLEKHRQLLGEDHLDTLLTGGVLTMIYTQLGRLKDAESLGLQVLEKHRRVLGEEHPDTLRSMDNLASTYEQLGRLAEAESLLVQALEKRKKVLGEYHRGTLHTMGILGATYYDLGQFTKAEGLEAQMAEKLRTLLGDDHPDTLQAIGNLALTYQQLGQFEKAEDLETLVLEKRRKLLGVNHPHTLHAIENLASIYEQTSRLTEGESLRIQVLEKRREVLGHDHPDTLRAMAYLAATYHKIDRFKEAHQLGVAAMEKQKRLLGEDHPDTLWTTSRLASTCLKVNQSAKAQELAGGTLEKQSRLLGENHPDTLYTKATLALTCQLQHYVTNTVSYPLA